MLFSGIESQTPVTNVCRAREVWKWLPTFCLALMFLSSLPLAAKVKAQGPVEQSSPEESMTSSLSGLDLLQPRQRDPLQVLPKEMWPSLAPSMDLDIRRGSDSDLSENFDRLGLNPLLVDGVLPYRANPFGTFLAATIVVAVQSLREQGRIDPQAIAALMNNTDFHAGWVGSATAAYFRRTGAEAGAWALRRLAPNAVEKIVQNKTAQHLGTIVNGLTYTVAVSGGYEYFSQFWKLATLSIPNVHTVTDLVQAPRRDQIRVLSNLLQYVANPAIQKRIAKSVSYHRIMTFEFLAMNVGLFVGMVAGKIIGEKIIPASPSGFKQKFAAWFGKHLSPLLGAVVGGVAVQFIPDGFKMRINHNLLDWKISRAERIFAKKLQVLQEGIEQKVYPSWNNESMASGVFSQLNLHSDLDAMVRQKDLLFSLYMQRLFVEGEREIAVNAIREMEDYTVERMEMWLDDMNAGAAAPQLRDESRRQMRPEELESYIFQRMNRDRRDVYYSAAIVRTIDRLMDDWEETSLFVDELESFAINQESYLSESSP